MKRLLIFGALLLMLAPAVDARRKRDKAGAIKDGVYTDKMYEFTVAMNEGWKVSIMKNEKPFRLVLVQKNYLIPTDYQEAPDYTKVPRIVVYADTTSMGVFAFVDSLVSESYDSDQKGEIKKEFEILNERDVIPRGLKRVEIGGERGVIWQGQVKYVNEVATSASSIGGKRVYGAYGAAIIGVKRGDTIILFHVMSEWQYFNAVLQETMGFVNSFTWGDNEGGGEADSEG